VNFGRIVVGVDGSENAGRALACAVDLARAIDAEVVAVHSVGLLERLASSQSHEVDPASVDIRHEFETVWCAPLNDADVRSLRLVRDGNPVSVLLDVAEEVGADLIVVGSRGLGGYPELLLGSTSTQVAQHSTRPVLIVPSAQGPSSQ
jgi:nucleotide-binding universal stress UspA family protein